MQSLTTPTAVTAALSLKTERDRLDRALTDLEARLFDLEQHYGHFLADSVPEVQALRAEYDRLVHERTGLGG